MDFAKPSTVLGLINGRTAYNCHIVRHEFGHVLGLEHEHQRSVFWDVAEKFLDVEKMKSDKLVTKAFFRAKQRGEGTDYDSDSIMHYWYVLYVELLHAVNLIRFTYRFSLTEYRQYY